MLEQQQQASAQGVNQSPSYQMPKQSVKKRSPVSRSPTNMQEIDQLKQQTLVRKQAQQSFEIGTSLTSRKFTNTNLNQRSTLKAKQSTREEQDSLARTNRKSIQRLSKKGLVNQLVPVDGQSRQLDNSLQYGSSLGSINRKTLEKSKELNVLHGLTHKSRQDAQSLDINAPNKKQTAKQKADSPKGLKTRSQLQSYRKVQVPPLPTSIKHSSSNIALEISGNQKFAQQEIPPASLEDTRVAQNQNKLTGSSKVRKGHLTMAEGQKDSPERFTLNQKKQKKHFDTKMGINSKLNSSLKTRGSELDQKLPRVDETIVTMVGTQSDINNESFRTNKVSTQLELINEGLKGSKIKIANSKEIQAFMGTNRKTHRSRIRDFETQRHNQSSYRSPSIPELTDEQLKNLKEYPNSVNTSNIYPAIGDPRQSKAQEADFLASKKLKSGIQENLYLSQKDLKGRQNALNISRGQSHGYSSQLTSFEDRRKNINDKGLEYQTNQLFTQGKVHAQGGNSSVTTSINDYNSQSVVIVKDSGKLPLIQKKAKRQSKLQLEVSKLSVHKVKQSESQPTSSKQQDIRRFHDYNQSFQIGESSEFFGAGAGSSYQQSVAGGIGSTSASRNSPEIYSQHQLPLYLNQSTGVRKRSNHESNLSVQIKSDRLQKPISRVNLDSLQQSVQQTADNTFNLDPNFANKLSRQKAHENIDGHSSVQILKRLNDNMSVRWRPRQFMESNQNQIHK